jgi:hypothetical protein
MVRSDIDLTEHRVFKDFVDRSARADSPFLQQGQAIAEISDHRNIVLHDHERAVRFLQKPYGVGAFGRRHPSRRLIEQEHAGSCSESHAYL